MVDNGDFVKLVVFVPETHADQVRQAMGDAGAGQLGTYSHCTFSVKGTGRFMPHEGADPHEGEIGMVSKVTEDRVETVCSRGILKGVIMAIKGAHPYEEVPIDIYPIEEEPE